MNDRRTEKVFPRPALANDQAGKKNNLNIGAFFISNINNSMKYDTSIDVCTV